MNWRRKAKQCLAEKSKWTRATLVVSVRCPPPNGAISGVLVSTINGGHLGALYGCEAEETALAHIRRKFVDVFTAQGSAIAEEAIKRIAQLYGVEKQARGQSPEILHWAVL